MSYYPPKIAVRPAPSAGGAELRCRKCHSVLAGLKSDEKCPECGLGVAISMQGSEIRYSDPRWVGRLRIGALFILWGTLGALGGVGLASANAFNKVMDPRIPRYAVVGACLVCVLGNWLLTAADPSGLGEKNYGTARKIARFGWLLGALGITAFVAGAVQRPSITLHWEYFVAGECCDLIALIGWVAMLVYLSKLAHRMRDTSIAERAKTLSKGFAIVGGVLIVADVLRDFVLNTQWAVENDLADLVISFVAIAALTGLVIAIAWILLLIRLGNRLKEQAKLARINWA